ncbi:MAG: homoserine O-acetyltransferase, partial [Muribaculaceae bacterium]|nr:homoserine O-acetyltransferase [Muribaculaceae bacterium]
SQQDHARYAPGEEHRACSYLRYQGEKLCRRFNAYSYMSILNSFDTHDIGRERGGVKAALSRVRTDAIVIGISSDIIFTPAEMKELASVIPGARYEEIDSRFGHDGFLVEHERLNSILYPFMNQ